MTEHEIAQKAFSANRERLKAERLKREAAGPPVTAKKAKTKEKARWRAALEKRRMAPRPESHNS
jgi:hypothetical protein